MSGIIRDEGRKNKQVPSCEKVHSAENAKRRETLLKLKQQESLLERNLINFTENMKLEPEVLRTILHDVNDVDRKRQVSLGSVKKSLKDITEELRSLKLIAECPEKIQNLDTNAYKQRLVTLSRNIRDFKESCRLESESSREQMALESELREFEMNLRKYESSGGIGRSASAFKKNSRCRDYREIQDFRALVAKTGHTDNWSEEDHLLFLKLRKKHSNIPALVAAVQVKCPDLTAEAVVNHEAWYKIYLDLREKQRSAVQEWRRRKETEWTKNREDETRVETSEEIARDKADSRVMEKLPKRTKINKCEARIVKTSDVVGDDRTSRKKELIEQWKAEKESKRLVDEQRQQIWRESQVAAQEKRRKDRLRKIQETLAEYRKRKSTEESSKSSKDGSRTGRKYDPMLIEAFRKQDAEYTAKKKISIARLQRPVKNLTVKIVTSQTLKVRDSTLLNPTKVWNERCKVQDFGDKDPRKLQYIKDVPRLYVQRRNVESMEIKEALTFS